MVMKNRNRFAAVFLALVMAASQGTLATAAEVTVPAQESIAAQAASGNGTAADGSGETAAKAGTGNPVLATEEASDSGQGSADTENGQSAADASSASENGQAETSQTESGQAVSGQTEPGQTAVSQTESGQTASGQTESGQTAVSQTESGQAASDQIEAEQAAGQTETAQLDERKLAEEPAKVQGAVRLTASIDGQTPNYGGRSDKTVVWADQGAADGTRLTLRAEAANLSKNASVTFSWTSNTSTDIIDRLSGAQPKEDGGIVSDTAEITLEEGVYAYFCTVTVAGEADTSRNQDYTLVYVFRDPLQIETKDTSIHISPKAASDANSGEARMEIKANLKLSGDQVAAPKWERSNAYDSWEEDNNYPNPGVFLTTGTLKGMNDSSCIVTCTLRSKYSPDAVYGTRTVTFTIDTENHTYGDWKVTKDATVWAAGEREHVCTVCGYKETESVPKLTPTISANMTSVPVQAGKTTDKFCVALANGDYIQKWESSNRKIFTVSGKFNGTCTIRARRKGRATITATAASGLQITALVKVQKGIVKTRAIAGLPSTVTVKKGQRVRLNAVLSPLTSQNPVTYKSSSTKIATVSRNGRIRGVAPGRCKVTVTSGKASVKVTVTVTGVDTVAIRNVRTAYTLKKGRTRQLHPKLTPANATSRIRYKSSNKKVVTVSSTGKLTARRKGTATITVRAVNLESASIIRQVTVTVR